MKVPSEFVSELAKKIEAAVGVIISSTFSIPAVLQNALAAVLQHLYGQQASHDSAPQALGSSRAQLQLRQILDAPELKACHARFRFLLGRAPQAFDEKGSLKDKATVDLTYSLTISICL